MHGERLSASEVVVATSANMVEDISKSRNPMEDMLNDAFGFVGYDVNDFDGAIGDDNVENNMEQNKGNSDFDKLVKGNSQPLYEGLC